MRRLGIGVLATLVIVLGWAVPARAATEPPPVADVTKLTPELADDVERSVGDHPLDVIVTATVSSPAARALQAVGPFTVTSEWTLIHGFAATMTVDQVRALTRLPWVRQIEAPQTFHATNDKARSSFGVDAARVDFSVDGAGTTICVLDTGIRADHEQFTGPAGSRVVGWKDFINGQTTPYDDHGHGTHVAGTAAGDGEGSSSSASRYGGVAPAADLVVGKVLSAGGSSQGTSVEDGVDWCAGRSDVDVISMSLGTTSASAGTDALSTAVNAAVDLGKVVVVAAGNSGDAPSTVGSPGAAAKAVTVGAVADPGERGIYLAPFSSRGPTLSPTNLVKPDVVAPGVVIASSYISSTTSYASSSGTSMATPFVAGLAALGLDAAPTSSPGVLKAAMESTTADRGPAGKDNDWGSGLVDAHAFLADLSGATGGTAFPVHMRLDDQPVSATGGWDHPIEVSAADPGARVAATVHIDGGCVLLLDVCWEWDPDLEASLTDPTGAVRDSSICPADDNCGIGRTEIVTAPADQAGTWILRVYPATDKDPKSGTVDVDLSLPGPAAPLPDPPATPTGVSATAASSSAIDVAWPAVTDAESYVVEHSTDGSTWADLVTVTATSHQHGGLVAGTEHHYRVRAANAGGESAPSSAASAITAPATPVIESVTATSNTALHIDWTNATGAVTYAVEGRLSGATTWTAIATPTESFADHTELEPATTYEYRVMAHNGSTLDSEWSQVMSGQTPAADPPDESQTFDTASSETTNQGSASGGVELTWSSEDVHEVLTEALVGGGKNARSQLEHVWHIDVAGGDRVTLSFEGHHSANGEGDHFALDWSPDGSTWTTEVIVITETAADAVHTYQLPSSTAGGIWVRARDLDSSRGNMALDSLHVDHLFVLSETLASPPPPEPTPAIGLSATPYKVKGIQHVDLGWSGASSTSIDVYRDGVHVVATANDGTYTDNIGAKGGGSYTYQVCEAGTSTCSALVTVVF